MYLRIKNYRQHKDLELNLPDTGLVLLDGPSGRGKSTVLAAIEDILFANVKETKSWSGGNPTGILGFAGFKATRTRTPNTFEVESGVGTLNGDAAEAFISKTLDMNYDEFMACSYVRQGFSNSLLDKTSGEMMRFIQKLTSPDLDLGEFKNKVKARVTDASRELMAAEMEYELKTKMMADYSGSEVKPVKPNPPTDISKFGDIKKEVKSLREKVSSLRAKFELSQAMIDLKNKSEANITKVKENIMELEANLDKSEKPLSEDEKIKIEKTKEKLFSKAEYLNKFNRILILAHSVHEKYPESIGYEGKITGFISDRISDFEAAISTGDSAIAKNKNDLEEFKKWQEQVLVCPKCSSELKLDNNYLVEASSKIEDKDGFVNKTLELINKLETSVGNIRKESDFLREVSSEANEIKKGMKGDDPAPEYKSHEQIQAEVDLLNKNNLTQKETDKKYNELTNKLTAAKTILASLVKNLDCDITEDTLSSLKKEGLKSSTRLVELEGILVEIRKFEVDLATYNAELKSWNDAVLKKASSAKDAAKAKKRLVTARESLASATRFKEVTDFAVASAVESKVFDINEQAAYFIDRMFQDDGTVVKLTNFSKVGSGEERAKIGVEVFHKGHAIKNTKPMSGGEKSRICLSFQLGLSNLYNSPLLMIDEGFTGLDADLKLQCLETLKEASEDKLILVVEHGAPEYLFDKVIKL